MEAFNPVKAGLGSFADFVNLYASAAGARMESRRLTESHDIAQQQVNLERQKSDQAAENAKIDDLIQLEELGLKVRDQKFKEKQWLDKLSAYADEQLKTRDTKEKTVAKTQLEGVVNGSGAGIETRVPDPRYVPPATPNPLPSNKNENITSSPTPSLDGATKG